MNLSWHNPANGRRYQAVVGPDLFGDSVLWRGWCGADGKRGGERKDVFTWEGDCLRALGRVRRRRQARGYVLLDDLLPCSDRGRLGGGPHKERKTIPGVGTPAERLVQVAPGDAFGKPS